MSRFLIQCLNAVLLAVIFLGLPVAAGKEFGNWRISPVLQGQELMLWALALAGAGNGVAALGLVKGRKERKLCWEWAAVFSALLGAEYAFVRGWFNFDWLKQTLLRLRKHF